MNQILPAIVTESLRNAYPRKVDKAKEHTAIAKALQRIVDGEIDGKPRTQEEAIMYLRGRLNDARAKMATRFRKHMPHLTTYLNQGRYNLDEPIPPSNLDDAISILSCYPGITTVDVDAHMETLRVIDEHIRYLVPTHGAAAASYMRTRTLRYAECVSRWLDHEKQYIPGPAKFFKERRYEQHESHWIRTPQNGYAAERDQLQRILQ